jgi:uncharacterized repeat protein (TIGR01451 family)
MTHHVRPQSTTRRRRFGSLVALATIIVLAAPTPALAAKSLPLRASSLADFDTRTGKVLPSQAQLSSVAALGATARWNRFGTPQSLIKYGGYLATGLGGGPEAAARAFVRSNRGLFKLTDADVTNLQVAFNVPLTGTPGRVIVFRQQFGSLTAAHDGLITVGITGGKVAYVSSSSAGHRDAPAAATLSATQAWLLAAADVGRTLAPSALTNERTEDGWTVFRAAGLFTPLRSLAKGSTRIDQRARLVALPMYDGTVRAAYETIVLDVGNGASVAYTSFVDARNGNVIIRLDRSQDAEQEPTAREEIVTAAPTSGVFQGTTDALTNCGPRHDFVVPAGTKSIDVAAGANIPANDIVLNLYFGATLVAGPADTATSPESIHYEPASLPSGIYSAEVCEFTAADPPFDYTGVYATNDVAGTTTSVPYPPKWQFFKANPKLGPVTDHPDYQLPSTDTRIIGCWVKSYLGSPVTECEAGFPALQNLASRAPWDHDVRTNVSTFTTRGNNASTAEAWITPLTPGPFGQRPIKPDRRYFEPWTNSWNMSSCDPTGLVVPGSGSHDILAAVTNLFVMHNRMHDWSYFLGFTEEAANLQENNFGNNPPAGPYPGHENDPEIGQAQAGAALPVEAGVSRDNANQVTLNDGIPGITNMYLWQPIAGGFYPPCVDGDYDMSVIGHEYTHAISNRMVGGPDANLSGPQAGAMGESWSDLSAVEYLNEYGFVPTNGESPYAVGSYVTGNGQRGIRNFNMSNSPLNYSDVGYDMVCNAPLVGPPIEETCPDGRTQVHADGEIWSATNFAIRQALISKYNASFPASNATLQRDCADGKKTADLCPGNRRWVQIMFDAFLLQQGSTSMLDARDAYLAADVMRFGGANQKELWREFARRGMGVNAFSAGTGDVDPIPSFESASTPVDYENEKAVTFRVFDADSGNAPITSAKIYVGRYEAAVTPIADTIGSTPLAATAKFVTGSYEFVVQAPGYGHVKFPRFFTVGGSLNLDIYMSRNRASLTNGAVATGTGDLTTVNRLIDDTEATNWVGGLPAAAMVTVDLEGVRQNVKRVNVSAMLNPDSGGRFTALRQFEIWTCDTTVPANLNCVAPTSFTKIYTSPADAFPGVRPRPASPDLILRSFDVPNTNATHVQLRVVSNQCTATGTGFRGEQDNDPLNTTDCVDGSDADLQVRAAELQVFSSTPALPPKDPAVVVSMTAPATATSGSSITYTTTYTNAGPEASSNAVLTDVLPAGLTFVSASNGGTYDAATRTVTWALGTVNVGYTGTRTLTTGVSGAVGSVIVNQATYTADLTVATPAAAITAVAP